MVKTVTKICITIFMLRCKSNPRFPLRVKREGVNFINVLCVYFCTKFWRQKLQSCVLGLTQKKLPIRLSYEKRVHKTLMTLTQGWNCRNIFVDTSDRRERETELISYIWNGNKLFFWQVCLRSFARHGSRYEGDVTPEIIMSNLSLISPDGYLGQMVNYLTLRGRP